MKVTDGFFLVGLSNVDADRARNIQLLTERSWFDVPLVYANQRRATIAIERGAPGERAFKDALTAWGEDYPTASTVQPEPSAGSTWGSRACLKSQVERVLEQGLHIGSDANLKYPKQHCVRSQPVIKRDGTLEAHAGARKVAGRPVRSRLSGSSAVACDYRVPALQFTWPPILTNGNTSRQSSPSSGSRSPTRKLSRLLRVSSRNTSTNHPARTQGNA